MLSELAIYSSIRTSLPPSHCRHREYVFYVNGRNALAGLARRFLLHYRVSMIAVCRDASRDPPAVLNSISPAIYAINLVQRAVTYVPRSTS